MPLNIGTFIFVNIKFCVFYLLTLQLTLSLSAFTELLQGNNEFKQTRRRNEKVKHRAEDKVRDSQERLVFHTHILFAVYAI